MSFEAFDPHSRGATKLARDWLPHLDRWEVRIRPGHMLFEPDGGVVIAGDTTDVPAPHGRQLIDRGSGILVRRRRIRAGR